MWVEEEEDERERDTIDDGDIPCIRCSVDVAVSKHGNRVVSGGYMSMQKWFVSGCIGSCRSGDL
jgi:hypothetical protein